MHTQCMIAYVYSRTRSHKQTRTHTKAQVCIHMHTLYTSYIHNVHTYIHTYIHTCIHYACTFCMCMQADYDGVLSHTLDVFKRKFEYFRENVEGMDELFEASFSSVAESGRPISRLVCDSYLLACISFPSLSIPLFFSPSPFHHFILPFLTSHFLFSVLFSLSLCSLLSLSLSPPLLPNSLHTWLLRCGKCRRFMKYIAARPQRLYCMHCDETFSLPQGGSIKLFKVSSERLRRAMQLASSGSQGA